MVPGTKQADPRRHDVRRIRPRAPGSKEPQRQAVTSGSVGTNDLKSSIGHILLPRIPDLQQAIDNGIDKMFGLVADDGVSSWDQITKILGNDRPTAAFMSIGDGLQSAGITLPVPDDVKLKWTSIDIPFLPDPATPAGSSVIHEESRSRARSARTSASSRPSRARSTPCARSSTGSATWARRLRGGDGDQEAAPMLQDLIKEELTKLRESVKREFRLLLIRLLDEISGVNVIDEKNRTVGDALHDAEDRVHEFEKRTSLEARLLDKDDLGRALEGRGGGVGRPGRGGPGWRLEGEGPAGAVALRDREGPRAARGGAGDAPARRIRDAIGDTIHEIMTTIRRRSTEARRRATTTSTSSRRLGVLRARPRARTRGGSARPAPGRAVWADRGSLYGDAVAMDTKGMQVDHEAFTGEAKTRAGRGGQARQGPGLHHAQSAEGNQAELAKRPAARDLLNLVDLIISHPEDSMWWRPIFDTYIGAHPDEVARHIRQRNRVRGDRTRVPS